mmetsp:Transcript_10676/g.39886  ORF Transcript_10676/g.39886 Transcript_10676/m.39886 type:complete len:124 (-) Transcript_10676:885-1256(-)
MEEGYSYASYFDMFSLCSCSQWCMRSCFDLFTRKTNDHVIFGTGNCEKLEIFISSAQYCHFYSFMALRGTTKFSHANPSFSQSTDLYNFSLPMHERQISTFSWSTIDLDANSKSGSIHASCSP